MRYHFFLHYGWFLQNLGKDFIRTNMHTTVCTAAYDNFWRLTGFSVLFLRSFSSIFFDLIIDDETITLF